MERKIGEIFTHNGKTYQVIETNACKDCAFKVRLCEALESITGTCIPGERTDHTSVSFKLINNMEIKNNQLTIDIPEGMEIDLENSNLYYAYLWNANLRNTNLKNANLYYANLEYADLRGANLASADLENSNLRNILI